MIEQECNNDLVGTLAGCRVASVQWQCILVRPQCRLRTAVSTCCVVASSLSELQPGSPLGPSYLEQSITWNQTHSQLYQILYLFLLYLILKCMFVIGRNRVTRWSLNLASALPTHLCLHAYSLPSIVPSLIIYVSLIFSKQQLEPLDWQI